MDILTEVRSSRTTEEELFVQRSEARRPKDVPAQPVTTHQVDAAVQHDIETATGVLTVLKDEPDLAILRSILRQFKATSDDSALNIRIPGPSQAKIIHALIGTTIPTTWHALTRSDRGVLAECLTSVAALNAILVKLRQYVTGKTTNTITLRIVELLELLAIILAPTDFIMNMWTGLIPLKCNTTKHILAWKEVIGLFGSERLISIPAEAHDRVKADRNSDAVRVRSYYEYHDWLTSNLCVFMLKEDVTDNDLTLVSRLLSKILAPDFSRGVAEKITIECLRANAETRMTAVVSLLTSSNKKTYLDDCLHWLSAKFTGTPMNTEHLPAMPSIAAILNILTKNDTTMRRHLTTILLGPNTYAIISTPVRWAMIKIISSAVEFDVASIIEKSISIFGDPLFMNHSPMTMQEAVALNIIQGATIQSRKGSLALSTVLRSCHHMQAISNRLACSNTQARWLGMIVGTALSRLTDKSGAQMNFGSSDMDTAEAKAWLAMLNVSFEVGSPAGLLSALEQVNKSKAVVKSTQKAAELPLINGKQTFGPPRPPDMLHQNDRTGTITEIDDASSNEDDDLKPYAKPDSDPEDSDEDATLVNRDKPKPPVYIRTLMSMLRETEKADRFQLGIRYAAPLIRRKIGFGREVTDHAEELARILTNLQDPFDTEDFDDLRLQALIAIVLSDVNVIAPWMSRQAFIKDYSIAQRAIMLTALGLSGRELAGLKHEDRLNRSFDDTALPSKRLPANMHAIYAPAGILLDRAATLVEQNMIQPMALAAADQTTSHLDAVKVRKFSSRMDVERTRRKPTANALAKVFGKAYFFPLIAALQRDAALHGDQSVLLSTPMVLTTLLKTVALLLHAAGPATDGQLLIIADFWELLLSLRVKAVGDISIMEAILFSILVILEVSYDKQSVIQNNPKQVMETKEWTEVVFDRTGAGNLIEGEGDEARVRMLAAGILSKINEVISQYRGSLLGGMALD